MTRSSPSDTSLFERRNQIADSLILRDHRIYCGKQQPYRHPQARSILGFYFHFDDADRRRPLHTSHASLRASDLNLTLHIFAA